MAHEEKGETLLYNEQIPTIVNLLSTTYLLLLTNFHRDAPFGRHRLAVKSLHLGVNPPNPHNVLLRCRGK